MNIDLLNKPLDPSRVKTREGSGGKRLSYIETHDAIRTANEIFGFGNWGYEVVELVELGIEGYTRNNRTGHRVGYRAIVKVTTADGASFSDVGYGDAIEYGDSSITPHELAAKEAVSDAVKRALKNFGDQFGLGLYDKDAPAPQATRAAGAPTTPTPAAATQREEVERKSSSLAESPVASAPSSFSSPAFKPQSPKQKAAIFALLTKLEKAGKISKTAFESDCEKNYGHGREDLSMAEASAMITKLKNLEQVSGLAA